MVWNPYLVRLVHVHVRLVKGYRPIRIMHLETISINRPKLLLPHFCASWVQEKKPMASSQLWFRRLFQYNIHVLMSFTFFFLWRLWKISLNFRENEILILHRAKYWKRLCWLVLFKYSFLSVIKNWGCSS